MLGTIVLLVLCILTAIAGVPLILKLIPKNEIYGVHTERAMSRAEFWFEVNWFAGWSLVAAAALTALALGLYNGTYLRSFWLQLLTYAVMVGIAVAASFWYEREVTQNGKRWSLRRKRNSKSRRPSPAPVPGQVDPRRHTQGQHAKG